MLPVFSLFSRRRVSKQTGRRRASRRTSKWRSFRPSIDPLEARNLLATFTVTNLDDSGAGSLREAIMDANANAGADLIRFARDVEGTISLTGQIVITDDVTIDGPGVDKLTVSGGGADRVFAILPSDLAGNPFVTPTLAQVATSPSVVIQKLAIKDGLATNAPGFDPADPTNPGFAFGGGLYNLGGTVRLERVLMADNAAANVVLAAGGAVANEFGGTLTVTRSEFDNNTTVGGLIAVGGAITSDLGPVADGGTTGQPNVTIHRSTFTGNLAAPLAGYIDGVAFSGLGVGGAILGVTGSTRITLSHFEGNSVGGGSGAAPGSTAGGPAFGGAVYSGNASPFGIAQSSLEVSRSTFIGNTASGGPGGAPGIPGGVASGGAIAVNNGGDAELTRNTFLDNEALGGVGGMDAAGGIATGGGVAGFGGADLTLERNLFNDNWADGGAGSGTGAGAAGRGGGLGLDSVDLAGFFPGTATATVLHDRYLGNVAAGGIGGGIYNEGDLTLSYTQLTDNLAVGETDVVIDFVPGYLFQGGALGGGLSNIGTINVDRGFFEGNQAIGADGATGPNVLTLPPGTAAPAYPGLAVGGGLHNIQDATVTGSRFVENEALAGNGNSGSFAGVANGGGVYSDGSLVLTRSFLHANRSVGGDNNSGDIGAGNGVGGGLASGTVTALAPGGGSASLVIDRSTIRSNEAVGGDGNTGLFPVPPAHLPAGGLGGGILVYQGDVQISHSLVTENRAVGGDGGNGVGGGILFWGFTGPVVAELSGSIVTRNSAVGGDGGNGLGGGIAAGSLGSLFGGPVTLTVHRSRISSNDAQGGGSGGDGLGGGIFNGSDGLLDLPASVISRNRALGGPGGVGVGGGLFNLGAVDDALALIFANFASTSDDDCFGC